MPRYRFRTTHGDTVSDPGDTVDLKNDEDAWEEATIACGEILKDLDGSLRPGREWHMDVHDETDQPVFTLRLISQWHRRRTGDT